MICASCRTDAPEGDRFCRVCGAVLSSQPQTESESRRTIAILFVDLVGWTSMSERLDPELLRTILGRYYAACVDRVAEHGGVIEKYVGDAVMAVFGVTVAHEDDALRAVRAAAGIVDAVGEIDADLRSRGIDLHVHVGVGSGEVAVTTAPGTHLRISGDAVNTAARLQSAAGRDQILVGAEVARLVRPFYQLTALPPVTLKGKDKPVPVWLVDPAATPAGGVRTGPAMVGRRIELDRLDERRRRAFDEHVCVRVDVVGPAGIGKTRLIKEFLDAPATRDALVLTGHCQSYGKDITYLPLIAMLTESAGGWPAVESSLGSADADRRARQSLTALLGLAPAGPDSGGGITEISWAVGHLLTALARSRPLILVWEDLQWGEPTLLDLISDLELSLREAPVLLLCAARGIASGQPAESGDGDRRSPDQLSPDRSSPDRSGPDRIELDRLNPTETAELVYALAGSPEVSGQDDGLSRIATACEGNPLFATVMLDMYTEDGITDTIPPTISALLRARLDTLPIAQRTLLQWAAVCGPVVRRRQLAVLAASNTTTPDGAAPLDGYDLDMTLLDVVERRLLTPIGAGRYRFEQMLMRDTAYTTAAKTARARWHALLAREAAPESGSTPTDYSSVLLHTAIHHAEAACLLLREISPGDPLERTLATTAAQLLAAEGTVALHRNDLDASISLLDRALALLDAAAPAAQPLTMRLCDALLARGHTERALRVLDAAEAGCASDRCRRSIHLQRSTIKLRLGEIGYTEARDDALRIRRELDADPFDDANWCLLHQYTAMIGLGRSRVGDAEKELAAALERAVAAGDRYTGDRLRGALCELTQWSPSPIGPALELCARSAERFTSDRLLLIPVLLAQTRLLALVGEVASARECLARAAQCAAELHAELFEVALGQVRAIMASLAGDRVTAQIEFAAAAAKLRAQGHLASAHTLDVYAVREALHGGNPRPAAAFLGGLESGGYPAPDERARIWAQLLSARLLCLDGRFDAAADLARSITIDSDDPCLIGDAWFEAAVILETAARRSNAAEPSEAVAAAGQAIAHYAAKGALVPIRSVYAWARTAGVALGSEESTWR